MYGRDDVICIAASADYITIRPSIFQLHTSYTSTSPRGPSVTNSTISIIILGFIFVNYFSSQNDSIIILYVIIYYIGMYTVLYVFIYIYMYIGYLQYNKYTSGRQACSVLYSSNVLLY